MKVLRIIIVLTAAAITCTVTSVARGENATNGVIFTTLKSDGTPNTWTQEDLVQALGLLNRKYHRDCETVSGRKAWHGKLKKEIVNTNELTKTEVYEDGTTFSMPAKIITPAVSVSNANKALSTNGIPAKLAAARLRRQQEKATTNIVTTVLKVN